MLNHKQFLITIPTQAYIARFLGSRYGSVITLYENTLLGKDLLNMIRQPLSCRHENRDMLCKLYNAQIKLRVRMRLKSEVVNNPSIEHIVAINQYLKKYFDSQLNQFCNGYVNPHRMKAGYKQAIEAFARIHGISLEEDITYECLKKADYRYRMHHPNFHENKMPVFPSSQISAFN